MDIHDLEAHADYWQRQAEIHPDDLDVLCMRTMVVAEFIVQTEAVVYLNPDLE